MLCKYWARLARHVSPCVHRAFTVFNGWNVGGESGSLLVFLFWFDQLLSITDIGNYPQKRREGRKKLAIIIFILSVMVFSYIEKKYCAELCNTASTDFPIPLTRVFYTDFFLNSNKIHVYIVQLLPFLLCPAKSSFLLLFPLEFIPYNPAPIEYSTHSQCLNISCDDWKNLNPHIFYSAII